MKKLIIIFTLISSLILTWCGEKNQTEPENSWNEDSSKEQTYNSESWKTIIPEDCMRFFDWCNSCSRSEDWEITCTMMFCEEYQEPKCMDDEIIENDENPWEDISVDNWWNVPVAKMRVMEWQTEEETQAMVENACSNAGWTWTDWACYLEDWSQIAF